jgi:SAM-dependent methyltransferase
VYLENSPTYETVRELFSWRGYRTEERKRKKNTEKPLLMEKLYDASAYVRRIAKRDKLTKLVHKYIQKGPLLDVGCGVGRRSKRFSGEITPYGIDIEHVAAEMANEAFAERGGFAVCASAIRGAGEFENEFFDGTIMYGYLEHEIKPLQIMKKVSEKLAPGGKLIVKVPNYASINRIVRGKNWCGYRLPYHVNFFTPKTLSLTLKKAGFATIRFGILDRLPVSDNMWLVAKKQ